MRRAPTVTLHNTALTERPPALHGCCNGASDTPAAPLSRHPFHPWPRPSCRNTNALPAPIHEHRSTSCPPPLRFLRLKASYVDSVIIQTASSPPVPTHEVSQRLEVLGIRPDQFCRGFTAPFPVGPMLGDLGQRDHVDLARVLVDQSVAIIHRSVPSQMERARMSIMRLINLKIM